MSALEGYVKAEGNKPVGGLVLGNLAGSAVGRAQFIKSHRLLEGATTLNGVCMARDLARVDDRVNPFKRRTATAGHAPEGAGGTRKRKRGKRSRRERVLHGGAKLSARVRGGIGRRDEEVVSEWEDRRGRNGTNGRSAVEL